MDQKMLSELFYYDEASPSGLRNKFTRNSRQVKDSVVGNLDQRGYWVTSIYSQRYMVHRLIYELHFGPIPEGLQIDHINRVRDDNRLENLRVVTPKENMANRKNSKIKVATGSDGM